MLAIRSQSYKAAAAADPDPRAAPASVLSSLMFDVAGQSHQAPDAPVLAILVALEGTATDTASFELWGLDETKPAQAFADAPTAAQLAAQTFYKLVAAISITVGEAKLFSPVPPGKVYLRCSTPSGGGTAITAKVYELPRS